LDLEQKFAEESPLPPPELAAQGVYCEGGCHTDHRRLAAPEEGAHTSELQRLEAAGRLEDWALEKVTAGAKQAPSSAAGGNGSKSSKPAGKRR